MESSIKRILVGLGGTPYTPCEIRYSIELATRHGARLTGVTVVDMRRLEDVGPVPLGAEGAARDLREHRVRVTQNQVRDAVDQFESACREAGVKYEMRQESGDPFDLMRSLARYHDVMIFGLGSLFDYGYEVHTPRILIELIGAGVRPIIAVAPAYREVRRVLLAYSGSMESAKAIRRFVQLRPWPDPMTRIITFDSSKDHAQSLLSGMAEYCRGHGLDPELHPVVGSPRDHLLKHAEEWDADLIVLGNSARSVLVQRITGETALYTIEHADRPLFLGQ